VIASAAPRQVVPVSLVRSAPETGGLSALDRVGQRLARGLEEFFTGLVSRPTRVSVAGPVIDEAGPTGSTAVRLVRIDPFGGAMTVAVGYAELARLTDLFYGGEGRDGLVRQRPFPSEERLLDRIAGAVCELMPAAWQPVAAIAPQLDEEAEPDPGPAVVQMFAVAIEDVAIEERAEFTFACRYPLELLGSLAGPRPGASAAGSEDGWQARLMESALTVRFPVRAVFAEPTLAVAQLLKLRPGDILPVCLPGAIELRVGGRTVARGAAGESNGRTAVRVEQQ